MSFLIVWVLDYIRLASFNIFSPLGQAYNPKTPTQRQRNDISKKIKDHPTASNILRTSSSFRLCDPKLMMSAWNIGLWYLLVIYLFSPFPFLGLER